MDNIKGILLLLVLILGAASFVLLLQSSHANSRVADAELLSSTVRDLLRVQRVSCPASPEQFRQIAGCLQPLLHARDFAEETFRQPDERRETTGYLVIVNENRQVYDAANLVLHKNREPVQHGCSVPGEIGHKVTCRFDYPSRCEDGDILEVFTVDENVRVFLKTC